MNLFWTNVWSIVLGLIFFLIILWIIFAILGAIYGPRIKETLQNYTGMNFNGQQTGTTGGMPFNGSNTRGGNFMY
jgi:hypothetical protein